MAAEDRYEEANMDNQVALNAAGDTEAPSSQESRPSVGATLFATTRLLSKAHQTKRQKSAQALYKKRSKSSTVSQEGVEDPLTLNADAQPREYFTMAAKGGEDPDAQSTEVPEWMKVLTMLQEKKIINSFLIFVPAGIIVQFVGCSETVIFIVNFLAMVPLASLLGDFTEEVAAHTTQMMGGLIQATLGNAVEVVVAIQALFANQIRVVQASLLGSVFSNMLLVLGCCFFFGGLRNKEQKFNATSAVANMSLLLLSSLALVLPTPLSHATDEEDILRVSRFSGIFLLVMYAQLLVFQFWSHAELFVDVGEESKNMSLTTGLVGLLAVTALVSVLSDFLVNSIDGFTEQAKLSKTFVGLILLPIIGNAVEHITAVTVAMKDKMELAMGVAVGSATQVSMFVVPVTVLSGWAMGRNMTLKFPPEEIILYVLSIIIVATGVSNGSSNWLQGSLLITTYVLVAVACWFEKIDNEFSEEGEA